MVRAGWLFHRFAKEQEHYCLRCRRPVDWGGWLLQPAVSRGGSSKRISSRPISVVASALPEFPVLARNNLAGRIRRGGRKKNSRFHALALRDHADHRRHDAVDPIVAALGKGDARNLPVAPLSRPSRPSVLLSPVSLRPLYSGVEVENVSVPGYGGGRFSLVLFTISSGSVAT